MKRGELKEERLALDTESFGIAWARFCDAMIGTITKVIASLKKFRGSIRIHELAQSSGEAGFIQRKLALRREIRRQPGLGTEEVVSRETLKYKAEGKR